MSPVFKVSNLVSRKYQETADWTDAWHIEVTINELLSTAWLHHLSVSARIFGDVGLAVSISLTFSPRFASLQL